MMFFRSCLLGGVLLLAGCTEMQIAAHLFKKANANAGPACSMSQNGHLKIGKPYQSHGVLYKPSKTSYGYKEKGIASWYGADFHGRTTANGECYDMYAMTAAHRTLPLPTTVRVTNMENKRSVVLRVNDRGPYAKGRIIDLSYAAARQLGLSKKGVGPVKVEAIGGPHHNPKGYQGNMNKVKTVNNAPRIGVGNQHVRIMKPFKATAPLPKISTPQVQAQPVKLAARQPKPQQHPSQPAASSSQGSFSERIAAKNAQKQPEKKKAPPYRLTQTLGQETQPAPTQTVPLEKDLPAVVPKTSAVPLKQTTLYVQIGAFSNSYYASKTFRRLEEAGLDGRIHEVQKGEKMLSRVQAGPFSSIAEADNALNKLVEAGFNSAVIAVE